MFWNFRAAAAALLRSIPLEKRESLKRIAASSALASAFRQGVSEGIGEEVSCLFTIQCVTLRVVIVTFMKRRLPQRL